LGIDAYLFGSIEFIAADLLLKTTNAEKNKGYSVRCSCGGLVGAGPEVTEVGQRQHCTGFGCVRVRDAGGFPQPPFLDPYFQYFLFFIFFHHFDIFRIFQYFFVF